MAKNESMGGGKKAMPAKTGKGKPAPTTSAKPGMGDELARNGPFMGNRDSGGLPKP